MLPGLLALSFVFYLLYGPVEVALPVHVATDLHGSAALLGLFWAVFGVGAVIGELSAPFLRRWRVWPIMTGIVLGWGLALVPLGLVTPLWMALAAFFAGAVIWGPWMSLSMAVLQDASPPAALAQVIAARSSLLIIAAPLGTALGGPIVAALGARGTLLASALATVALGWRSPPGSPELSPADREKGESEEEEERGVGRGGGGSGKEGGEETGRAWGGGGRGGGRKRGERREGGRKREGGRRRG